MTVGAAIVVVAAVSLLIISPGFSKLAIIVFLAGAIGIVYLINQNSERSRQRQAQQAQAERFATTAIRPEDLSLGEVKLVRGARGLLDYEWLLQGVLTNNSGHGLEALTLEVTVMDCGGDPLQISGKQTPQSTGDCLTVGQQRVPLRVDTSNTYQKVVVPPGQTRNFTSYAVHFDGIPPTVRPGANRTFTWKLVEVRAAY